MSAIAGLLAGEKRLRMRAVRELPSTPALAYALRRVLYTDADAEVRAAAARRLGELPQPTHHVDGRTIEGWLVDAIGDRSPLVRDTLLRALAKVGSPSSVAAVRVLVETDRLWWVRRTAVYTLAALAGASEVATFKAVLADPFWRVRHAAVKVLAVLGARDLEIRDEVIAAPQTPTLAFLRASWGPVAVEAPTRAATGSSALPLALLDPDPAVVTARLAGAQIVASTNDARPVDQTAAGAIARHADAGNARRVDPSDPHATADASSALRANGADARPVDPSEARSVDTSDRASVSERRERVVVSPLALVELLCDPHAPLRLLAADRLLASGDPEALRAMLDWLEEPRIPHVADVVETLADRLGDPAAALAAHALDRAEQRPGAARWALAWVVATSYDELYESALVAARRDPRLRAAALRIATIEDLVAWAGACTRASITTHEGRATTQVGREPDRATTDARDAPTVTHVGREPARATTDAHGPPVTHVGREPARATSNAYGPPATHVGREPARATTAPRGRRDASLDIASGDFAPDPLVDAIAIELHARRSRAAHDALLALDTTHHAMAYTLELDAAAHRELWDRVEPALDDPHHGPRAIATRWLARAGRLSPEAVARLAADPDPSVREALATTWRDVPRSARAERTARPRADHAGATADTLPDDTTSALLETLVRDDDPWVARAALERLVDTRQHDATIDVATALDSGDAWLRGKALELPIEDDRVLERAVVALADHDAGVRSAALDALEQVSDVDARLAALAPAGELATRMIHAWLRGEMLPGRSEPQIELDDRDEARRAPHRTPARVEQRPFGRAGFSVAPLAISGAFDLSPSALHVAADAGVNLWFWEPAYESLTRFVRGGRDHVIAGSYHADARSIEADVDRALRLLKRDALDVLLLFWSRSPARIDARAYEAIDYLKRSGKVRALGFSTHHRTLAREAIEASPWDVVMIRHSAAHPGIETELLPVARERGTAIVTFSALCYGRMLSGPNAPSAADCYRYTLSQPGVTACISAPRRRREVIENAEVLEQPILEAARLAALRVHGIGVRTENQRFNTLLRQPTRDAAEAARALLASELPPSDELVAIDRPLPRPTRARPARTNLGKTRTRR